MYKFFLSLSLFLTTACASAPPLPAGEIDRLLSNTTIKWEERAALKYHVEKIIFTTPLALGDDKLTQPVPEEEELLNSGHFNIENPETLIAERLLDSLEKKYHIRTDKIYRTEELLSDIPKINNYLSSPPVAMDTSSLAPARYRLKVESQYIKITNDEFLYADPFYYSLNHNTSISLKDMITGKEIMSAYCSYYSNSGKNPKKYTYDQFFENNAQLIKSLLAKSVIECVTEVSAKKFHAEPVLVKY